MAMASNRLTSALLPDEPMLGVKLGIVARVCLPDWTADGVLACPAVPTRAITMRSMALSLGDPPETTRRHVNLLRDRGVFTLSAQGVSLAATADNLALVERYYLGVHDLLLRLIEDVHATCDIDLTVGTAPQFTIGDVIGRSLDILLMPIDTYRPVGSSLLAFLLWGALTVVAVRTVTHDPVLARRYANEIPPDELRIGTSLRELAAALSIPYATAWRQVHALQAENMVTRLAGNRWTVLTRNLLSDSVREISAPPSLLLLRKIRELAQLGLDPARAAAHYRQGRPPLADLGAPRVA
ncbi:hypothetical protein [Sphingomonas colocasiae]|uniref:Uncharacterized protein n=1 Tax=Sphingomonas colocasiae TaxID=1848973 RepID=A0ABS7PYB8_9SPHN|nr:hypothetical protein [Sphingomonas colocasiae]MBY8826346.1 hypothetical protein [Sphingomonas colocasiae]